MSTTLVKNYLWYAPEGFLENFVAENLFAGTAMGRRASGSEAPSEMMWYLPTFRRWVTSL
jgi:alkyl sulfatase BDS1-like metallo-beta-lactamase superfamily hydrolase